MVWLLGSCTAVIGIEAKSFLSCTRTRVVLCATQFSGVRAFFSHSLNIFALFFISHVKQKGCCRFYIVKFFLHMLKLC